MGRRRYIVKARCSRCLFDVVQAHGLCRNCWGYRRRTGQDRPPWVITKHVCRVIEDNLERG